MHTCSVHFAWRHDWRCGSPPIERGTVARQQKRLALIAVRSVRGASGAAAIFLHTDCRVAELEATFQHGNLSRGVCPVAGASPRSEMGSNYSKLSSS